MILTSKSLPTLLVANINAIVDELQRACDKYHRLDLADPTSVNKVQDQKGQFKCVLIYRD